MTVLSNKMAKYHLTTLLVLLGGFSSCFSQSDTTKQYPSVVTLQKILVGLDSGIEWEQKLGRTTTLSIFAGMGVGFASSEASIDALKSKIIAGPASYISFKKYYNLNQRLIKGKSITHNSADFFIGHVEVYFPVENQNYIGWLFSQGWGTQRQLGKRINFELQLGITEHIFYDNPQRGPYIRIHPLTNIFSLSYIL